MFSFCKGLSLTGEQEPAIERKREGDKSMKEFQLLAAATVLGAFELFSAPDGFVCNKRNQKSTQAGNSQQLCSLFRFHIQTCNAEQNQFSDNLKQHAAQEINPD